MDRVPNDVDHDPESMCKFHPENEINHEKVCGKDPGSSWCTEGPTSGKTSRSTVEWVCS